jgi:hypothetical protein
MNIGEVEQAARIVAIGAGIIFGGWALSSVIWVWTKKQIYAYGGSGLSLVGIVLMGLSIYKTVDVHAAPDGIGIKLAEVEKLIKEQGEAQKATQVKLAQLPSDIGPKIPALDKTVKDQGVAWTAQFRDLQTTTNNSFIRYLNGVDPSIYGGLERATAPIKMNIGKSDDGKAQWVFFAPDVKDPAYVGQLQKQIDEGKQKYGESHPNLVNLYMNLGEAYQAKGQKQQALDAYQKGIEILKSN